MKGQYSYLIVILSIALLLACTSSFGKTPQEEMVELEFAVLRGMRYWGESDPRLPKFPVKMVDYITGHPTFVGGCRIVDGKSIELLIVRGYWHRASNLEKTWLMVHELGHCMFHLDHSDNPNDIMSHIPPGPSMMAITLENLIRRTKLKGAP